MKQKKVKEVQKFGGTDKLGEVKFQDKYEVSSIEAQSKTKLQDDPNEGNAVIIRRFEFGINPVAWQQNPPSKQDLFNYHLKGIEMMLWRDGMKIYDEVQPRLVIDPNKMKYFIFVSAKPQKGHILREVPKPLVEQLHV